MAEVEGLSESKEGSSSEEDIKFGPTIFGDEMGAIGKEVENEAKEHAHQYDLQFSSQWTSACQRRVAFGVCVGCLFFKDTEPSPLQVTVSAMQQSSLVEYTVSFRPSAFYQRPKSKVGLAAAKAVALRVNLNIDGCGVVAPPRVHQCVVVRLVHTSFGSSYIIAHVLHCPPPPRAQL